MLKIKFDEIKAEVLEKSGIYEIYTNSGVPLKVGIGNDMRRRLLQHRASRQSALKLKPGGNRTNPNDVESKQSILAKHLYYDESLTHEFDLKSEVGRQAFLSSNCYILFEYIDSRDKAKQLEALKERQVLWRYIGKVVKQ